MTQMPDNFSNTAAKLDRLDKHVTDALIAAQRRHRSTLIVTIVVLILGAAYFGWAYWYFAQSTTPMETARLVSYQINSYMPEAEAQLHQELQDHKDDFLDAADKHFKALPARLISYAEPQVVDAVKQAMPDMEQRMVDAYKAQLATMASPPASTDPEVRFKQVLGALDDTTQKQVAATFADYESSSGDVIDYLALLGKNQDLTHREQLQRATIAAFLTLVQHENNSDAAADVQSGGGTTEKKTATPATAPAKAH